MPKIYFISILIIWKYSDLNSVRQKSQICTFVFSWSYVEFYISAKNLIRIWFKFKKSTMVYCINWKKLTVKLDWNSIQNILNFKNLIEIASNIYWILKINHFKRHLKIWHSFNSCKFASNSYSIYSWFSSTHLCIIPSTNFKLPCIKSSLGCRSFSFRAPHIWNSLPLSLKTTTSLSYFTSHLKTFLFPP